MEDTVYQWTVSRALFACIVAADTVRAKVCVIRHVFQGQVSHTCVADVTFAEPIARSPLHP